MPKIKKFSKFAECSSKHCHKRTDQRALSVNKYDSVDLKDSIYIEMPFFKLFAIGRASTKIAYLVFLIRFSYWPILIFLTSSVAH